MRAFWPLRIIFLLFLTPALAAMYLLWQVDSRQLKTTQHGIFIQPVQVINFKSLYSLNNQQLSPKPVANKWHAIYICPSKCDLICHQQKQLLAKVHIALGPDQERVSIATTTRNMLNHTAKDGSILIIDPLGFYIMYYEPDFKAQDFLKDLKRLLKYSHAK